MILGVALATLLSVSPVNHPTPTPALGASTHTSQVEAATPTLALGETLMAAATIPVITPTPRDLPLSKATSSSGLGVFNSVAISAARLPAAGLWQEARQRDYTDLFNANCAASRLGSCDSRFATRLRNAASQVAGFTELEMLDHVNRAVNAAMTYRSDRAIWGVGDRWATPIEMAGKGAGDCEDFAIAKYWLLRSLGVSDDKLQMVVLQDTRRQLFHAVLVVHTASGAYVLDNVTNRLQLDTAYAQYQPIMSFAGGKNYIHGFAAGSTTVAAMPGDLSAVAPGLGM
jgi:predicted transglutaminase-like cysteine proteinase